MHRRSLVKKAEIYRGLLLRVSLLELPLVRTHFLEKPGETCLRSNNY